MEYHTRLKHVIDALQAAPRTNHMPHFAPALEAMNAPQIRKDKARARYIIGALCVALGMALAALAFSNAYARGLDAVNNPHIEGF